MDNYILAVVIGLKNTTMSGSQPGQNHDLTQFLRKAVQSMVYYLSYRSSHMSHKKPGNSKRPQHSADADQLPTRKPIIGHPIADHGAFETGHVYRKGYAQSPPSAVRCNFSELRKPHTSRAI